MFTSTAEQYDRFMGRYSTSLAPAFADVAGVRDGMRVLDVGCGTGKLTSELAARVGDERVAAIDPSANYVAASRERHPAADIRDGTAEQLPWEDDSFDVTMASLVIAFMEDPGAGLREMARVTRPGGTVAACMWDVAGGGMTMLATFWAAAISIDPGARGEAIQPGMTEGDIAERMRDAGLERVAEGAVEARVDYAGFEDFWVPFTYGVGPAGQYLRSLAPEQGERLRDACRTALGRGDEPFTLTARAWYATGTPPGVATTPGA